MADKLVARLSEKLDSPGLFVGEKVSSLIKALEDILAGINQDAGTYERAAAAPRESAVRAEGIEISERIARITDPDRRDRFRSAGTDHSAGGWRTSAGRTRWRQAGHDTDR